MRPPKTHTRSNTIINQQENPLSIVKVVPVILEEVAKNKVAFAISSALINTEEFLIDFNGILD